MRNLKIAMIASTVATAALAIAAPAMAQNGAARPDMTRAQVEAKAAERFAKMDANNDGVLNAADREARRAAMFDRMDTDNNGAISRAEFEAMHAARGERRGARAERRGGEHAGQHAGHRMGGHRMGGGKMGGRMGMAQRADTNNDRAISRAEFTAAALTRFDRTDADRNGTVTQAERQAARQAMRAQWQERRAQRQAN